MALVRCARRCCACAQCWRQLSSLNEGNEDNEGKTSDETRIAAIAAGQPFFGPNSFQALRNDARYGARASSCIVPPGCIPRIPVDT